MELDQSKTPLFDAVKKYVNDKVIQFHVPGHKQGRGLPEFRDYIGERVLQMDANGMDDLDYLNNPTGVILESQELLANAFNADKAFFLVNGTTAGVQAMIMSVLNPRDKIILPRNAHKSAVGGIILSNAIPIYVQPEINQQVGIAMGVTVESIKKAIEENPDAKAVFIINPTYYGAASDLKSIVRIAHSHGMIVLVDEAHGSHMHFHNDFPLTAMEVGADMSALSIHKTAGSLTQSSVLLVGGKKINLERVKQILNLMATSSASYLLMCSLDIARKQLSQKGFEMLDRTIELARFARYSINKISGLYCPGKELIGTPGCFDFDETKLGIYIRDLGYSGYQLEKKLRKEYNIQVELSDLYNILSIITLGDRKEDIEALIAALDDIASKSSITKYEGVNIIPETPKMVIPPREAFYSNKKTVDLDASLGKISGEIVTVYPPGIPLVCPGEEISREIIDFIKILKSQNCEIQGPSDPSIDTIKIVEK